MMPTDPFDASIPVLTEILQPGAVPHPQPPAAPSFFYRARLSEGQHSEAQHNDGQHSEVQHNNAADRDNESRFQQTHQDAAVVSETATVSAAAAAKADTDAAAKANTETDAATDATTDTTVNMLAPIDGIDPAWHALEQQLSERILHRLQEHVDGALEQRINACLAQALRHAIEDLSSQIRLDLHQTVAKIVASAVADELTSLKSLPK
jgi:hypothetical protein